MVAATATASASTSPTTSPFHFFASSSFMDPTAITARPDCNLWFADAATPDRIGRITASGVITEFTDPS
jgi:hypothetical protein